MENLTPLLEDPMDEKQNSDQVKAFVPVERKV